MLKYSEIKEVFNDNNIDIIEYNDETNDDIDLPLVVYIAQDGESFGADNVNYFNFLRVAVVLLDETMNFFMQRQIESVFYQSETYFEKNVTFAEDERLYSITYIIQVIDDEPIESI